MFAKTKINIFEIGEICDNVKEVKYVKDNKHIEKWRYL
jgi:hypothetical protein